MPFFGRSPAVPTPPPAPEGRRLLAVARCQELKPGQLKGIRARGGLELTLANVDGRYYAFDAYCPHQHWPLKWGAIDEGTLICALHMWRFDLETGAALDPPMAECVQTFPLVEHEGMLYVALPED